ncbi:MAG: GNAT family N-acetyltransferase [Firmicutes bacterium]|nr:GNAT family N-acetyltransferase [Bacillota bacterium]
MEFRFADEADFEAVNRLARQVHELHVQWRPDLFRSVQYPITPEEFSALLQEQRLLLAQKDGTVVAYAVFAMQEFDIPKLMPQKTLKLEEICVEEAYRRQGIAKALLQELMRLGKAAGCTDLRLTCDPHNAAGIAFYESLGMQPKVIQYQCKL